MAEERISPYSLTDLKNTTDDALGNYLRGLRFQQNHAKLDVRLGLGYVAVGIAGAIFAADYRLGWQATKGWTAAAVVAYGVLNAAFTYWMWAVERGLVFEGSRDGRTLAVRATTKKHDPTYYLTVTTTTTTSSASAAAPTPPAVSERTISAPFATWFTADGYFVARPLQQWLASSVEAIGDVDVKNAGRDERDELAAPSAEVSLLSSGDGATGADVAGKSTKKGKRKA